MFKTENLIGQSVYETPELICMVVHVKYDNTYITQILVSLPDFSPHFDENWIDDIDTNFYLSREQIKKEIVEGVLQYRNLRNTL